MSDPRAELERAITEYAHHMDPLGGFEMLTDWVVVTAWSTIEGDNATYGILTPDRNHPAHRVLGLLQVGMDVGPEHDHD